MCTRQIMDPFPTARSYVDFFKGVEEQEEIFGPFLKRNPTTTSAAAAAAAPHYDDDDERFSFLILRLLLFLLRFRRLLLFQCIILTNKQGIA